MSEGDLSQLRSNVTIHVYTNDIYDFQNIIEQFCFITIDVHQFR